MAANGLGICDDACATALKFAKTEKQGGQPLWAQQDALMTVLTIPRLGRERSDKQYRMRTLDDSGAPLSFGSDWPVITPDRWLADFAKLDIRDEIRPKVLKANARRLLGI